MSDYTQLAKALREQSGPKCTEPICSKECDQYKECGTRIIQDAAAAIEELDAEETRLLMITSELQDKVVELEEELNDVDIAADDNARQVEELQARLCEAENSVERWKDMYLTKHEPKRGKFVYVRGDGVTCCDGWKCSACGKTYRTNVPYFGEYNFCPNCGAKMEAQDGK